MPRPNYGNAVKQRAVQFFTVLVDYANDELDLEERRLEILQRQIQFNWQTERRCAIRTKVRYLEDLCRLASVELTNEQIKESIKCLTDFLGIIEDNRTSKGGSETWHFTLNLWHDRFDRSANIAKFNTEWDLRKSAPASTSDERTTAASDEWLELVRSSLVTQQYHRLTTNPLMGQERLKFSLDEVYIPLGSIENPSMTAIEERDRHDDFGGEIGEKTIPNLDRFLAQLIGNSEPNRIGIIGEPGSGKTTCLQKLAAGLLERKLLPIWVSLADLQGESLENYLLQDWLKVATKKIIVDAKLQQDFADRVASGRVWLLLDAVDEMAIAGADGKPFDASISLANLARQFRGWLGNAHIIITCRSNVWNSGKNALENFTTYRNLGLSYGYDRSPNQIRQFIQSWFKDRPHLGELLTIELGQPQYQRLRDAIKNPLRLALLCSYWWRDRGKLPSTKAILYQQFTDTIYEWKQDRFPTTLAQRQQLDLALGKLALAAIDGDLSSAERLRFRLEHHTVLAQLDPELLELALQLGWLNRVGISARTGAKIYAFYHSTFQEYFAARSIDRWQDFFKVTNGDRAPIFSPHWQETILFWFGRSDVPNSDKAACIDALINFDRQCGGFYYYRAYFLAAIALAEFPESVRTDEIIDRLLQWRFAEYLPEDNTWTFYPLPIQDGARVALRQTDRVAAIAGLERFVQTTKNPFLCWQAAHSLGKVFDLGNAIATQSLVNSIPIVNSGDLKIKICESLIKIAPHYSQIAIDTLVEIVNAVKSTALVRKAAFTLGKLAIDLSFEIENRHLLSTLAIDTLSAIIESGKNPETQIAALDNLRQIAPTHPIAQRRFTGERTLPSNTRQRRKKTPYQREIAIAIAELEQKLANVNSPEVRRRYAYQLGKFQPGHPLAVDTLLTLMSSPQNPSFYKRTGEYLKEIILSEQLPLVINRLKDSINDFDRGDRSNATLECYKLLWYCADRLPESQFIQAWNLAELDRVSEQSSL